jgi:hypothetical protein
MKNYWKFFVCIGTVKSHTKLILNDDKLTGASAPAAVDYEWNPCAMICNVVTTQYLDFVLKNKKYKLSILVKRVPLEFDKNSCKMRIGDVELWYGFVMDSVVISVVRLYAFRNVQNILYNKIGNKLVAMINGIFYLGRCQKYEARNLCNYYWFSSISDDPFKGLSPRNESSEDMEALKEHAMDLAMIKAQDGLRSEPLSVYPYYPDNSVFENQQRRLPVTVSKEQDVIVDFYNFKFIPPRQIRVYIPKNEMTIVNALSRSSQSFNVGFVNKDVTEDVVLQLFFQKDKTTDAIVITSMALKSNKEEAFVF